MDQSTARLKSSDETPNVFAVVENLPADLLTPLSVYLKLSSNSANSFLLESVEGGESLARYSFIGANPETIVAGDDREIIVEEKGTRTSVSTPFMEYVRSHFAGKHVSQNIEMPAFVGGAIGYLGFDCADWFEPSLKSGSPTRAGTDDAMLMFFRSIVAFDHAKQVIRIISLVFADEAGDDDARLQGLFDKAEANNKAIRAVLETGDLSVPKPTGTTAETTTVSNWKRDDFESAVAEIKEMINAGECYQVVLSQCFTRETAASAVSIYRAIRSINPSPYMFLLRLGNKSIIGASPEMLVRCEKDGLEYRPIAGTRPRGQTADEDSQLAEEMRHDVKEVAEHQMLVDLGRNDLGRVAEYGSVKVEALMNVEKYSHVQHLVSSLSAKLADDYDRFDAFAACFPAGTVSGAPKVRAIEIIRSLEPTLRGVYAGAVGYFDYSGNMDTCIAIRTLVLENGVAKIQAGAGIVADSVPEREFQETVDKARVLLKAIEIAETGVF